MSNLPVVDDYMVRTLTQFSPDENIHSAAKTLLEKHISGAPVVDDNGNLVGVLSKKDCLQVVYNASYHKDWGGRVEEYMSREVRTIESGTDIVTVADLFVESCLIIELKACKALANEHTAQVLGYLRASNQRHALLINFGAPKLEVRKFIL